MWLIHTDTLLLEFFQKPPPRYAILSHVWTDQECSFQEFQSLNVDVAATPNPDDLEACMAAMDKVKTKKGYKKIEACCKLARSQNIYWAWVDTCCIDKTSSAELSESINSMFAWYKLATVCYVYLDDVDSTYSTRQSDTIAGRRMTHAIDPDDVAASSEPFDFATFPMQEFREPSRWYSRGWTLQELLAPSVVEFYNSSWAKIDDKLGLRGEISDITGIPEADLVLFDRSRTCIAQKMSWASTRSTSRLEDQAYSLLGLFGVHLPLLYGEGSNAFRRLQEELIRTSTDHTIFAWMPNGYQFYRRRFLAESPSDYKASGSIASSEADRPIASGARRTYAITNAGLEIQLPVLCRPKKKRILANSLAPHQPGTKVALLSCGDVAGPFQGSTMGVLLRAEASDSAIFHVQSIWPLDLAPASKSLKLKTETLLISFDHRPRRPNSWLDAYYDALGERYQAKICVGEGLAVRGVHREPDDKPPCQCVDPGWLPHACKEPTEVMNNARGVYCYQPPGGGISEAIVFKLSTRHPGTDSACAISVRILHSAPRRGCVVSAHESAHVVSCHVESRIEKRATKGPQWRTSVLKRDPERIQDDWEVLYYSPVLDESLDQDGEVGVYTRRPTWSMLDSVRGPWFKHPLPNGQTLVVTASMRPQVFEDLIYFGVH